MFLKRIVKEEVESSKDKLESAGLDVPDYRKENLPSVDTALTPSKISGSVRGSYISKDNTIFLPYPEGVGEETYQEEATHFLHSLAQGEIGEERREIPPYKRIIVEFVPGVIELLGGAEDVTLQKERKGKTIQEVEGLVEKLSGEEVEPDERKLHEKARKILNSGEVKDSHVKKKLLRGYSTLSVIIGRRLAQRMKPGLGRFLDGNPNLLFKSPEQAMEDINNYLADYEERQRFEYPSWP